MFSTRESAACGTHRSVVDTQHFDRIKCLAAEAGVAIQYKLNTLSPAQASCEHSPQLDRMKKICFVKSTKHLTWIAVFKGQWPPCRIVLRKHNQREALSNAQIQPHFFYLRGMGTHFFLLQWEQQSVHRILLWTGTLLCDNPAPGENRCCIINQVDSAAAVLNLIRARATVVMNDDRNRWWKSLVQYNNNNQQRDKFIKIHYCNNNFASLCTLYSVCDICTTDEGHTPR